MSRQNDNNRHGNYAHYVCYLNKQFGDRSVTSRKYKLCNRFGWRLNAHIHRCKQVEIMNMHRNAIPLNKARRYFLC